MPSYGAMNNPDNNLLEEIKQFKLLGFDFIDITPDNRMIKGEGYPLKEIKNTLQANNMQCIGHTPWWLPINNPYPEIREATTKVFLSLLDFFHELGAPAMNLHLIGPISKYYTNDDLLPYYVSVLGPLIEEAEKKAMTIMIENIDGSKKQQELLTALFAKVPQLKFHLDIGHANIKGNPEEMLNRFYEKIIHIHVSDNNGRNDQHLPIGAGTINWEKIIALLKKYKYEQTITFEVFTHDLNYLIYSIKKFQIFWEKS